MITCCKNLNIYYIIYNLGKNVSSRQLKQIDELCVMNDKR